MELARRCGSLMAMDRTLRSCVGLLLLSLCASLAAQEMYKCKDAAGKITYSGKECSLIGLTSAGEVTGRVSVQPAYRSSQQPAGGPSEQPGGAAPVGARSSAAPSGAPRAAAAPAKQKADNPPADPPDRRCFTVKTAKGTATRCNDVPDPAPDPK